MLTGVLVLAWSVRMYYRNTNRQNLSGHYSRINMHEYTRAPVVKNQYAGVHSGSGTKDSVRRSKLRNDYYRSAAFDWGFGSGLVGKDLLKKYQPTNPERSLVNNQYAGVHSGSGSKESVRGSTLGLR